MGTENKIVGKKAPRKYVMVAIIIAKNVFVCPAMKESNDAIVPLTNGPKNAGANHGFLIVELIACIALMAVELSAKSNPIITELE